MNKKYELTNDVIEYKYTHKLYRIRALRNFGDVKKGDLGGYISKEKNLSHEGDCWVYDNAKVCENAEVYGNAQIRNNAKVINSAKVYDYAKVYDNAVISYKARVLNHAKVYDSATLIENTVVKDSAEIHNDSLISNSTIMGESTVYDSDIMMSTITNNSIIYSSLVRYATIGTNGYIRSTNDYFVQGPIGSRNDFITFYKGADGGIYATTGCFDGLLDLFANTVYNTHKDNKFYKQYLLAIQFIKEMFDLK